MSAEYAKITLQKVTKKEEDTISVEEEVLLEEKFLVEVCSLDENIEDGK